jgi:hypothetical protein
MMGSSGTFTPVFHGLGDDVELLCALRPHLGFRHPSITRTFADGEGMPEHQNPLSAAIQLPGLLEISLPISRQPEGALHAGDNPVHVW